jgi:hypothetical protein
VFKVQTNVARFGKLMRNSPWAGVETFYQLLRWITSLAMNGISAVGLSVAIVNGARPAGLRHHHRLPLLLLQD